MQCTCLKRHVRVEDADDPRAIHAKVTGHLLTLDETLQVTIPALLALYGWGSKTYYTQLRLNPLPPVSADALSHAVLGDEPSLVPLTQRLIARAEGSPFFLEESVGTLVEIGVLVGEHGAYRLAKPLSSL